MQAFAAAGPARAALMLALGMAVAACAAAPGTVNAANPTIGFGLIGDTIGPPPPAGPPADPSDPQQQPFLSDDAGLVRTAPAGSGAIVNVRLGDDVADYAADLKAQLAKLDFVHIAEPADFELTTMPDYPLTLVLADARQPPDEWEPLTSIMVSPQVFAPRSFELGNLEAGDFALNLQDRLREIGRIKALLALAERSQAAATRTCFATGGTFHQQTTTCARGEYSLGADSQFSIDDFVDQGAPVEYSVLNTSIGPKYIAVVAIDAVNGVTVLPLKDHDSSHPLAPGHWDRGALIENLPIGRYHLLTVASDGPIDPLLLVQPRAREGEPVTCDTASPGDTCAPAAIATGAAQDWSVTDKEFRIAPPVLAAIGNGRDVLAEMAPWATQIYSTFPYSNEEIATDLSVTRAERKFLLERTSHERDHVCGGTLIAPDVVATAAHCVAKPPFTGSGKALVFKRRRVRVGSYQLGEGGTTFAIDAVAVNAGYVPGEHHDDIALLHIVADKSTQQVALSEIDLPEPEARGHKLSGGTPLVAFGWGLTGATRQGQNFLITTSDRVNHNPDYLQFGPMKANAWKDCSRRLKAEFTQGMLCASGRTKKGAPVFTCVGDSGGPLVQEAQGTGGRKPRTRQVLAGIVSWTVACGDRNNDSVFTDVAAYRGWIDQARKVLTASIGQVSSVPNP